MVLSAYLEGLVRGRRVAVLGDATLGLAERLAGRGARLVHAYDPEPARTAEAIARAGASGPGGKPVAFAVLEGDLGVRDGAFDVVVVPDLSAFPDPVEVLRRARRLVPSSGVVVVSTPNPSAERTLLGAGERPSAARSPLDYYQLYDAVALQFPVVRMLGQAPFVGYAVVDFAPDGEVDVSVDTSLLDATEEPEWFVAVAGERPARLEPFAVIEVPFADLPAPAARGLAQPSADPVAFAEAQARVAALGAELERMRERERGEAERREREATALSARVAELESDVEAKAERLREVEGRAGDAHVRAERLGHDLRDLDEELRRQRDRAARLTKQLDDEKRARTKAEVELGLARGTAEAPPRRERPPALEGELEAARARIAELEVELDQVATTRVVPPPMAEPVVVERMPRITAQPALRQLAEAEEAAEDAQRRTGPSAAERDATRAEVDGLEGEIAIARTRLDELTRARSETEREAAGALGERDGARARAEELATALRGAEQRAAEAAAEYAAARGRIDELERELDAARRERDELAARVDELEEGEAESAEDAAAAEVTRLEGLLLERGHVVAALQRDLRESERIGRELLGELEALQTGAAGEAVAGGAGEPAAPADAGRVLDLTTRLDALAEAAAACEADLVAARWRIAQLEHELVDARAGAGTPPSADGDLERALDLAQREIATLRASGGGGAQQAVEQGVLLEQLSGELRGR
jgi:SAM-dependent methyltransferase